MGDLMKRIVTMSIRLMGPDDTNVEDRPDELSDFYGLVNKAETEISDQLPEGWYVKIEDVS